MPTNDFVPFCATDTGTNLLSQANYLSDADRPIGNQPGVARSKLVNKAIRQATYIAGQLAQLISNKTGTDILDDATPAKLLAQFMGTVGFFPPRVTTVTATGAGTFNLTYLFQIVTGSATAGATYTNNTVTYTVKDTVASGTTLYASGSGAPLTTGTLTKASGTGDATITFYAVKSCLYLRTRLIGAGSGGGAGATGGGAGGSTTLASTLLVAGGGGVSGTGGGTPGAGGTNSSTAGPVLIANIAGANGGPSQYAAASTTTASGGEGGLSAFGGQKIGAGGRGGAQVGFNVGTAGYSGPGGGGGGYLEALIYSPASTYAYSVGAGGTAGAGAGSGSGNADVGNPGIAMFEEHYQ